ncbi:ABC transporter ATP-binding protein [bacterium]|nr:ABC transporter ATP-binding protein [bacterium]
MSRRPLALLKYAKPYVPQLIASVVLAALYTGFNVLFLPLARDIVTEISNRNLTHFSNQIFNAIALFGLRLATSNLQYVLMTSTGLLMSIDIRSAVYDHLLRLPQSFYQRSKLGDILTRLSGDSEKVREVITMIFWELIPNLLTFFGIIGYLIYLSPKLTLLTLTSVPVFVAIIMFLGDRLRRISLHVQQKTADITHFVQETLSNIKLVQAYTNEAKEVERYKRENMRGYRSSMKGIKFRNIVEPFITFLQYVVVMMVVWYGGYEISRGALDGPSLVSFFAGIAMLIDPVLAISKVYGNVQTGLASADRMLELMDTPVDIADRDGAKPVAISGTVTFSNVSFSYDNTKVEALKGLTFDVRSGESIALVGLSGAGKSSLIHLIPRFYDCTSGQILIDGVDIKDIGLQSLRRQIALVPQEDILFRGSILENIRYGRADATTDEVIEVAHLANAWEFIEKRPRGIHSRIGDRGNNLSGGQKQRISIARAILRNPRILLLDEATSALDPKSEGLVQDALNKLMKGRTTFVIAHRLSTIRNVDRIFVMSDGKIVEAGSHDELMALSGRYAQLYRLQFAK